VTTHRPYPATLEVEYPESLDRFTTFFRLLWIIPILIIAALISVGGLWFATALMIAFQVKYPRWWFDYARELARFEGRVGAYAGLLTDQYPSTTDAQAVRIEFEYPEVGELNRWLPLVKWLLAIPHYVVLAVLAVFAFLAVLIAWFAILFTGRYPRGLFDFVVGFGRWVLRVEAYAFFLVTDRYPPFSLK
jgi:hypothetical protein